MSKSREREARKSEKQNIRVYRFCDRRNSLW